MTNYKTFCFPSKHSLRHPKILLGREAEDPTGNSHNSRRRHSDYRGTETHHTGQILGCVLSIKQGGLNKALATKPNDLTLILRIPMGKRPAVTAVL